jgi:hypothetical protein
VPVECGSVNLVQTDLRNPSFLESVELDVDSVEELRALKSELVSRALVTYFALPTFMMRFAV